MEAFQKVRSHPSSYYSVILLDIDMPIMDGKEACVQIKKYFDLDSIREEKKSTSGLFDEIKRNRFVPLIYALTS